MNFNYEYHGKFGDTFLVFSVPKIGLAMVAGGWIENIGENSNQWGRIYRSKSPDYSGIYGHPKGGELLALTNGALFLVEPGYKYFYCSQGSLPIIWEMNK